MQSAAEALDSETVRAPGGGAPERRALFLSLLVVTAVLAAVSGSLFTAPLFGEDPLVLSFFRSHGVREAAKDFTRPQYGLSSVRFYRPLTSLSLAVQGRVSWDPAWLRSANLLVYWIGAVSTVWLARALGVRWLGATFAGAWVALFPGGPGDWCWIIGRVDAFSFGFGMAGLALFAARGVQGSKAALAGSGALVLLSLLSKETAVALPVALLAIGLAVGGTRGLLRALVPCGAIALGFLARRAALGFWGGGYVGGPATIDALGVALGPRLVSGVTALTTGVPQGSALWVVLAGIAFAAARAMGDRAVGRRLLAVAAGAVALYVVGALTLVDQPTLEALHARTFPGAFALVGIGLALLLDAPRLKSRPAQVLALGLLAFPLYALEKTIGAYTQAAGVIEGDLARIEEVRPGAPADGTPVFVEGAIELWPIDRPTAPLYASGVGLARRFEPPFAPAGGTPVWPLKPIDSNGRGEGVHIAANSTFASRVVRAPKPRPVPGVVWRDGEVKRITLPPDVCPPRLTEEDAIAMTQGRFDYALKLPPAPPGTSLRVTVFTAVGFGVGRADPNGLMWKSLLLTLVDGSFPLYQIPGLAVDFRETQFFLRFEWLDAKNQVLLESNLVPVAMGPDFADFVRHEADARFGIVGG